METPLQLRWLGVAGIELCLGGEILAIDPFFTRPALRHLWLGRPAPDRGLVAAKTPRCTSVLVSHAHWDHLMDVPEVLANTGATALGSPQTCQLLRLLGVGEEHIREIRAGDRVSLGAFQVEVLPAEHLKLLGRPVYAGPLRPGLRPPLRLRDYRADGSFSFLVQANGLRLLDWCSARPGPAVPADILFVGPYHSAAYYGALLGAVRPRAAIPVHWDDHFRPLSKPLRPYWGPPRLAWPPLRRMDLQRFAALVEAVAPSTGVFLPAAFQRYSLRDLLAG